MKIKSTLIIILVTLIVGLCLAYYYFVSSFQVRSLTLRGEDAADFCKKYKVEVIIPSYAENTALTISGGRDPSHLAVYTVPAQNISDIRRRMSSGINYKRGDHFKFDWNMKNEAWDLKQVEEGIYRESNSSFTFFDIQTNTVYTHWWTM